MNTFKCLNCNLDGAPEDLLSDTCVNCGSDDILFSKEEEVDIELLEAEFLNN